MNAFPIASSRFSRCSRRAKRCPEVAVVLSLSRQDREHPSRANSQEMQMRTNAEAHPLRRAPGPRRVGRTPTASVVRESPTRESACVRSHGEGRSPTIRGVRVLVVDDSAAIRAPPCSDAERGPGESKSSEAHDADEALEMARRRTPEPDPSGISHAGKNGLAVLPRAQGGVSPPPSSSCSRATPTEHHRRLCAWHGRRFLFRQVGRLREAGSSDS